MGGPLKVDGMTSATCERKIPCRDMLIQPLNAALEPSTFFTFAFLQSRIGMHSHAFSSFNRPSFGKVTAGCAPLPRRSSPLCVIWRMSDRDATGPRFARALHATPTYRSEQSPDKTAMTTVLAGCSASFTVATTQIFQLQFLIRPRRFRIPTPLTHFRPNPRQLVQLCKETLPAESESRKQTGQSAEKCNSCQTKARAA